MRLTESPYVIPITQARIDFGVICRIETGIRSIEWMKKRKQVNAAEDSAEWPVEKGSQLVKITGQAVDVSDELDLVFQCRTLPVMGARTSGMKTPTRT